MKIFPIHAGYFKLDGGAMFGVVPKVLWEKENPPDEKNLCTWSARCMLIDTGDRRILVDTGLGNKQDEKFFQFFEPHGNRSLKGSLREKGYEAEDITDVFLTHLHFDHCGGAVEWGTDGESLVTAFPNAIYWSNEAHWNWATDPNPREKGSFLKENILPIKENGQLEFIPRNGAVTEEFFPGISVWFVNGHTEAQMLPVVHDHQGKTVVFAADLLPSSHHVAYAWGMAFDVRPLETIREKETFLKEAADNEYILFLEHDPVYACCTVQDTEKKGLRLKEAFHFEDAFEVGTGL